MVATETTAGRFGWAAARAVPEGAVARTAVRLTAASDDRVFWREWRVRAVDGAGWEALRAAGAVGRREAYRPVVLEARRVDATAAGEALPANPEYDWRVYEFGEGALAVMSAMMGDSTFRAAESLCPGHAAVARHADRERAARLAADAAKARVDELAGDAIRCRAAGEREFARQVAPYVADEKRVARTRDRLAKVYVPRYKALVDGLEVARAEHSTAVKALKAVEAADPVKA
jgi:hypothetical protein